MRRCSFDQVKRRSLDCNKKVGRRGLRRNRCTPAIYAARATTLGNLFATCDHSTFARLALDFSTSSARVISGSIPFSISAFRLRISMSTGTPLPS